MPISKFVHLRVQSSYSMLESTLKVAHITELAKKHNMPALALTDRNNLFAALEFAQYAISNGVQPINGIILNLYWQDKKVDIISEILILAKNKQGFQNLLELASIPYIKYHTRPEPHIKLKDLLNHKEGLIILSAFDRGPVGKLIKEKKIEEAEYVTNKLKEEFADDFYFEIFFNELHQIDFIEEYLAIASKHDIPPVATNNVLMDEASIDSRDALVTLHCIRDGKKTYEFEGAGAESDPYYKYYFCSEQEIITAFAGIECAIENTIEIAKKCSFAAEEYPPSLPSFSKDGQSEDEELRKQAHEGLQKRLLEKLAAEKKYDGKEYSPEEQLSIEQEYKDRLDYELDVICKMGFPGYFLIVSDFIKWSKENKVSVGPGRGSGAGSLVAWSLFITDLDPIKFGLLFERFLNPERVSMPDFDIDFCQERRDETLNYVRQKYGSDHVAQIITFGSLQARAVIKDVARSMSLPYSISDKLSKLVPFNAVNPVTLDQAIKEIPELKRAYEGQGLDEDTDDKKDLIAKVLRVALRLEGIHRHASTHAAGIVISRDPLVRTIAIYNDSGQPLAETDSLPVIQYSMKYAEKAGLVKFDFLGLKTLTVIAKCEELIKKSGQEIDLNFYSFTDKKTYELYSQGRTNGVFQFESAGMKDSLKKLKPDCIEDIIALGALYRPGPMDNIPTYIACKHGSQEPDYLHPILKPILLETYGVIIYQEQVMEIAKKFAGYSLGAADLLRRAMGKKIKAEMDAQEKIFVDGAKENGVSQEQAKAIFALVAKFAGYGFNKSHAAAYGAISYQTAYLKANFPVEFFVASLNLDIHDTDKIHLFINEAQNTGVTVGQPDVNNSGALFEVGIKENGEKYIIYGLSALKSMSLDVAKDIVEERVKKGKFKSLADFTYRLPASAKNKKYIEALAKSGAFDSIHQNRKEIVINTPYILKVAQEHQGNMNSGQASLFSMLASTKEQQALTLEQVRNYNKLEKVFYQHEIIGFYLNEHPVDLILPIIDKDKLQTYREIEQMPYGNHQVKLIATLHSIDAKMSPRGRYINMVLSDNKARYEASAFEEEVINILYNKLRDGYFDYLDLPRDDEMKISKHVSEVLVLGCDLRLDQGGARVSVRSVEPISDYFIKYKEEIRLKLKEEKDIIKLKDLSSFVKKQSYGLPVYLELPYKEKYTVQMQLSGKILPTINNIIRLEEEFEIIHD